MKLNCPKNYCFFFFYSEDIASVNGGTTLRGLTNTRVTGVPEKPEREGTIFEETMTEIFPVSHDKNYKASEDLKILAEVLLLSPDTRHRGLEA